MYTYEQQITVVKLYKILSQMSLHILLCKSQRLTPCQPLALYYSTFILP